MCSSKFHLKTIWFIINCGQRKGTERIKRILQSIAPDRVVSEIVENFTIHLTHVKFSLRNRCPLRVPLTTMQCTARSFIILVYQFSAPEKARKTKLIELFRNCMNMQCRETGRSSAVVCIQRSWHSTLQWMRVEAENLFVTERTLIMWRKTVFLSSYFWCGLFFVGSTVTSLVLYAQNFVRQKQFRHFLLLVLIGA